MELGLLVLWPWCLRRGTTRDLQRLSYCVYRFTQIGGELVLQMPIQRVWLPVSKEAPGEVVGAMMSKDFTVVVEVLGFVH